MKRYRRTYRFIKALIIAIGVIVIATWLIIDIFTNLKHEYLLITRGVEVPGEIIKVDEEYEDDGRGIVANVYYNYAYSFYLPNGVEVISGGKCNELTDLPDPVEVVYLEKNPEINRLKSHLPSNVKIFFKNVVILDGITVLLILIIGGVIFRIVVKELVKELRIIKNNKSVAPGASKIV